MRPTDLTVGADREAAISGEVFLVRSTPMTYVEATPACARSRRSAARSRRRASATGQPRLSGRPHVPVRPGERGPALTPVAPRLAFPSPPCLAPAPSRPRSNALRVTFGRPLTFSLYILIDRPCDPGSSSAAKPPRHGVPRSHEPTEERVNGAKVNLRSRLDARSGRATRARGRSSWQAVVQAGGGPIRSKIRAAAWPDRAQGRQAATQGTLASASHHQPVRNGNSLSVRIG